MASPRPVALRPADMAELLKPLRLEIYESLQVGGPATVAGLASRLGRAADSLYYHVRKLVDIGVVERRDDESSGRSGPGRNGAVFGVAARAVMMELDMTSRRSRETWAGSVAAVLRLAERDVRAALEKGDVRTEGVRRNLLARRLKARLTDKELRRVNALQDELQALLSANADSTKGRLYATTCVMTPLEERTRR